MAVIHVIPRQVDALFVDRVDPNQRAVRHHQLVRVFGVHVEPKLLQDQPFRLNDLLFLFLFLKKKKKKKEKVSVAPMQISPKESGLHFFFVFFFLSSVVSC